MPRNTTFSDEDAKTLIREVRRRGCLWDPNDDRYNDRYHMARAWSEISSILHVPEDKLRVKWKNMRDLYKKEFKKYGPALDDYTGKWRHYTALTFLNKTSPGNTSEHQEDTRSTDIQPVTKEEYIELECDDDDGDCDSDVANNEVEVFFETPYGEQDPLPEKRMKLSNSDEDFDIMFLKSLAPYFKQLDPIRKLVVRSKMQDMLLNEIAAQSGTTKFQLKKS